MSDHSSHTLGMHGWEVKDVYGRGS
jgi:hypothetical protein